MPSLFYRDGAPPPSPSDLSLNVNFICRVIIGPLALAASWVPFRLLARNGEFAACTMVVANCIPIIYMIANAAIWHTDDVATAWQGHGWCDLQVFTQFAIGTMYSACVCAIMRRLAQSVGLSRVADLSSREKRNRVLIQALIIFPLPVLQVALTFVVQGSRYQLMPIHGCGTFYDANPVYLVFFVIPSPIYTAAACVYAVQAYLGFRQIHKTTQAALNSSNSDAASRSQKAKRKLFIMTLTILVPYAPEQLLWLVFNILANWPWYRPFDFAKVHAEPQFSTILSFKYAEVSFIEMNMDWISVITVFIFFVFFGTSAEAVSMYKRWFAAVGVKLGMKTQQRLDKDTFGSGSRSWGASTLNKSTTASHLERDFRKGSFAPSTKHISDAQDIELASVAPPSSAAAIAPSSSLHTYFDDMGRNGIPSTRDPPSPRTTMTSRPPPPPPQQQQQQQQQQQRTLFNPGLLNWTSPQKFPSFPVPSFLKLSGEEPALPRWDMVSGRNGQTSHHLDGRNDRQQQVRVHTDICVETEPTIHPHDDPAAAAKRGPPRRRGDEDDDEVSFAFPHVWQGQRY